MAIAGADKIAASANAFTNVSAKNSFINLAELTPGSLMPFLISALDNPINFSNSASISDCDCGVVFDILSANS